MPTASSVFPGGDGAALGLRELISPPEPTVDIILIHGLGGNSFDTWLHSRTETFWPTELLPRDIPTARIMAFGYDADVLKFFGQVGVGTVRDHASTLVGEIASKRRLSTDASKRPIVLVAHSLGGLIAKKALLISAGAVEESYQMLDRNIRGICFLGTPHRGSDLAELGSTMGKIVKLFTTVNTAVLDILRRGSEVAWDIQQEFCTWLRKNAARSNVICFWEERRHPVVGTIVAKDSATIDGYLLMPIPDDHVGMSKFANLHVPGYVRVLGAIRDWLGQPLGDALSEQSVSEIAAERQTIRPAVSQLSPRGQAFLRRLWFRQMFAREDSIKPPYESTCEWIRQNETFANWQTFESSEVWILGFPGAGKSTVMKYVVDLARTNPSGPHHPVVLSHFFSGSGTPLQQSIDGLLRSLTYQMIEAVPSTFTSGLDQLLRRRGSLSESEADDWDWDNDDYLALLNTALAHVLQSRDVQIYIDDLHECRGTAEDVRNLCRAFQNLAKKYETREKRLAVCFSNRYYPIYAPTSGSSSIKVEEHIGDSIYRYVREKLTFPSSDGSDGIQSWVSSPTPYNFRWVVLVTEKALDMFQSGQSKAAIVEMISTSIPDGMGETYDRLLQTLTGSELSMSVKLFHLLCISPRVCDSLSTIRHLLNHRTIDEERLSDHQVDDAIAPEIVDDGHLERLLPNLSCGLVWVHQFRAWRYMELAHPTVKRYMMHRGFMFLDPSYGSAEDILQRGSQRVAGSVLAWARSSMSHIEPGFKTLSAKYSNDTLGAAMARLLNDNKLVKIIADNIETLQGIIDIGDAELTAEFIRMKVADAEETAREYSSTSRPASRMSGSSGSTDAAVVVDVREESLLDYCADMDTICCLADLVPLAGPDDSESSLFKNVQEGLSLWVDVTAEFQSESATSDPTLRASLQLLKSSSEIGFKWVWSLMLFCMASSEGHVELVQELLDRRVTGLEESQMRRCLVAALHCAAVTADEGVLKVLSLLLDDSEMDVEAKQNGDTALIRALDVRYDYAKIVKLLLERGASLLARSAKGESTISLAFKLDGNGELKSGVVAVVLEHVRNKTQSGHAPPIADTSFFDELKKAVNHSLPHALKAGNPPTVKLLLDHGADPNMALEADEHGQRPLHFAASRGNGAVINLLLKAGANVNKGDKRGRTPLHAAVEHGRVTACNVLLLRGAEVDARDANGHTALFLAREARYLMDYMEPRQSTDFAAIVKTLLSFKADIDASFGDDSEWENSLLGKAIKEDNPAVAQLLLDRGAGSFFSRKYKTNVLHVAVKHRVVNCTKMLIGRPDIDVNFAEDSETVLHIWAGGVYWDSETTLEMTELMLKRKDLDMNPVDTWGYTPLHRCITRPWILKTTALPFLKLLLERDDLEVNKMDAHYRTALHHAVEEERADMVAVLLKDERTDANGGIDADPRFRNNEYFAKLQDLGGGITDVAGERSHFLPIFNAAKHGNLAMIKLFLAHPALRLDDDPDVRTGGQYYAPGCLQAAAAGRKELHSLSGVVFDEDYIEIIRLLCQREDLGVNKRTIDGTALDIARTALRVRRKELQALRDCLARGANAFRRHTGPVHWVTWVWGDDWTVPETDSSTRRLEEYLDEHDTATYGDADRGVQLRIQDLEKEIAQREKMTEVLKDFGATASDGPAERWDSWWSGSGSTSMAYLSGIRRLWKEAGS